MDDICTIGDDTGAATESGECNRIGEDRGPDPGAATGVGEDRGTATGVGEDRGAATGDASGAGTNGEEETPGPITLPSICTGTAAEPDVDAMRAAGVGEPRGYPLLLTTTRAAEGEPVGERRAALGVGSLLLLLARGATSGVAATGLLLVIETGASIGAASTVAADHAQGPTGRVTTACCTLDTGLLSDARLLNATCGLVVDTTTASGTDEDSVLAGATLIGVMAERDALDL